MGKKGLTSFKAPTSIFSQACVGKEEIKISLNSGSK